MRKLGDITDFAIQLKDDKEKIEIDSDELAPFLKTGDTISITFTHSFHKDKMHLLLVNNSKKVAFVKNEKENLELEDLNNGKLCYSEKDAENLPVIGIGYITKIMRK